VTTRGVSIDLVICTYNNSSLLDCTLDALRRQRVESEVEWSVLVVNNNCTDDTEAVVRRHVAALPVSLTMVREPEQGLTPARLRGVTETTGEWIAFVDDDCIVADDWIEGAAGFAAKHPTCGGFGSRVILDWEESPPPYVKRYTWAFAHQDHGPGPKKVKSLAGAGSVVRREALIATGWVARRFLADRIGDKLISGGDVEMALRLGANHDLWYNPACGVRHRIPARRTTLPYLKDVTYGLGTSKLLGDSMLWPGTYPRWIRRSILESREWAGPAIRHAGRALLGRGGRKDAVINLSFLRGWWVGIWRLLRMDPSERRALLGCAAPTPLGSTYSSRP
jgi:glycosyltransferase involved in cell wall biosynthesis